MRGAAGRISRAGIRAASQDSSATRPRPPRLLDQQLRLPATRLPAILTVRPCAGGRTHLRPPQRQRQQCGCRLGARDSDRRRRPGPAAHRSRPADSDRCGFSTCPAHRGSLRPAANDRGFGRQRSRSASLRISVGRPGGRHKDAGANGDRGRQRHRGHRAPPVKATPRLMLRPQRPSGIRRALPQPSPQSLYLPMSASRPMSSLTVEGRRWSFQARPGSRRQGEIRHSDRSAGF